MSIESTSSVNASVDQNELFHRALSLAKAPIIIALLLYQDREIMHQISTEKNLNETMSIT